MDSSQAHRINVVVCCPVAYARRACTRDGECPSRGGITCRSEAIDETQMPSPALVALSLERGRPTYSTATSHEAQAQAQAQAQAPAITTITTNLHRRPPPTSPPACTYSFPVQLVHFLFRRESAPELSAAHARASLLPTACTPYIPQTRAPASPAECSLHSHHTVQREASLSPSPPP